MLIENPQYRPVHAWTVLFIASLFFFYEFIQMNMFDSLADSFEQTFHISTFQIGLISAFYFLSDTILLFPVGVLLDRFSSKKLMLLGVAMCIIGTLLISVAHDAWFLVLARFLSGFSSAFCLLSILRIATQWFPANRLAEASGVAVTIGMLGGAVSQVPLTLLIQHYGWRDALIHVAILGIIILLLIACIVRDAPAGMRFAALQSDSGHHRLSFWHSFAILANNTHNWLTGLYIGLMNLPIILLAGLFGTQYMELGHGFSHVQSSSISMMIFIGTIIGSTVFGFISDWLGSRRQPMFWAALLSLILFLSIMYMPGLSYQDYMMAFFALGFITAAQIIGYPVVRELNPSALAGSALGFISIIIMGLPILLQPLTAWILQYGESKMLSLGDFNHALWVLVIGFIVSIIITLLLPETYGQKIDKDPL